MTKTKKQRGQEKRLRENIVRAKLRKKWFRAKAKTAEAPERRGAKKPGGAAAPLLRRLFGGRAAPDTAQRSIPYLEMHRDGGAF